METTQSKNESQPNQKNDLPPMMAFVRTGQTSCKSQGLDTAEKRATTGSRRVSCRVGIQSAVSTVAGKRFESKSPMDQLEGIWPASESTASIIDHRALRQKQPQQKTQLKTNDAIGAQLFFCLRQPSTSPPPRERNTSRRRAPRPFLPPPAPLPCHRTVGELDARLADRLAEARGRRRGMDRGASVG